MAWCANCIDWYSIVLSCRCNKKANYRIVMDKVNFDELFSGFKDIKVGVIGDVMLDTYWWGDVERISPEAPVPVVALDRKEYRIGGAGNVALNTISLGSPTTIFTVIGDDEDGKTLNKLFSKHDIDTSYIIQSAQRITTNK